MFKCKFKYLVVIFKYLLVLIKSDLNSYTCLLCFGVCYATELHTHLPISRHNFIRFNSLCIGFIIGCLFFKMDQPKVNRITSTGVF